MRTKSLLVSLVALMFFTCFNLNAQDKIGHSIKVSIKGWADSSIILGHYFNKKLLVNDTITLDAKGNGAFKGVEKLDGGIYFLYFPNKEIMDFLLNDDQSFELNTEKPNYLNNLEVKGSSETLLFSTYQKFIAEKQNEAVPYREKAESLKGNIDSLNFYRAKLEKLDNEVKQYWNNDIEKNPNTFYASFLKAIQEVNVPEPFVPFNEPKRDSIIQWNRYYYYKAHAFDNINLSDPRMYLTPFLAAKIETFITQTIFQIPDTVAKESIALVEKSRGNEQAFKYMLSTVFNLANESKIMGMDKVVIALADKYYLSGLATWADKEFLTKLQDRVYKMKPNVVGNIAPDLKLETVEGEFIRLSEVVAPYTILVFWEPECGHCQKEIPKLYNDVYLKYKSYGLKVVAVYAQTKTEPWVKFIEEKSLIGWYNVYDPHNFTNFRNLYDVYSTPIVYVLDKDKRIMAKRISVEDLPGFFNHYFGISDSNTPKPVLKVAEEQ